MSGWNGWNGVGADGEIECLHYYYVYLIFIYTETDTVRHCETQTSDTHANVV